MYRCGLGSVDYPNPEDIKPAIFPLGLSTDFPLVEIVYVQQHQDSPLPRLNCGGLRWSDISKMNRFNGGTIYQVGVRPPLVEVLPLRDAMLSGADVSMKVLHGVRALAATPEFYDRPRRWMAYFLRFL
jgi:hypothetical protein